MLLHIVFSWMQTYSESTAPFTAVLTYYFKEHIMSNIQQKPNQPGQDNRNPKSPDKSGEQKGAGKNDDQERKQPQTPKDRNVGR